MENADLKVNVKILFLIVRCMVAVRVLNIQQGPQGGGVICGNKELGTGLWSNVKLVHGSVTAKDV